MRQLYLHCIGHRHEFDCATMKFGVPGGDWVFCPTPLNDRSVVYTFGVGNDVSFDTGVAEQFGCDVHGFDPTPRAAEWVRSQKLTDKFKFHELGIASIDGTLEFHQPKSDASYHFTPVQRYENGESVRTVEAPVRRLTTIMRDVGHDHVDLLKLDIEGGEYDVIDDLLENNVLPGQLLVEFHHMYATIPWAKTRDAVAALRKAGYGIMHISPRTYEYTFMRRDLA